MTLQETHSTPTTALQIERDILPLGQHTHSLFWSHSPSARNGVVVIVRKSPHYTVSSLPLVPNSTDGRYVNLSLTIPALSSTYNLLAIYAPAHTDAERNAFFLSLPPLCTNSIVMGDFNMVLDPLQDKISSTPDHGTDRARTSLSKLMDSHNLVDVWRFHNPNIDKFTYHREKYAARLDRILTPESLLERVVDTDVLVTKIPDHYPVTLTLNLATALKGHDRYFMNTSLLRNEVFMDGLIDFMYFFIETYPFPYNEHRAILEWWELFKRQNLNHFYIFSPLYAKARKTKLSALQDQDTRLTAMLQQRPHDPEIIAERKDNKIALAAMEQHQLEGAAIRSNLFHNFVGERIPKYIAKYEKNVSDLKSIPYLTTPSGTVYDPPSLLSHAREYWGTVFQSPEFGPYPEPSAPAAKGLLKRYKNSPLPRALYDSLDAPLSFSEFDRVVRSLPTYRSNGPDGLPYEFYAHSKIWECIGEYFYLVMVSTCALGDLPPTMSLDCDIVCLHKKGSRDIISNYRPISVLNCDYRIFARVLVSRLNPVARFLVHRDQTGFIKGRLISDNGMLLQSLIEYAEWDDTQVSGAMIFLDFEKAFDSVQWSWITQTLIARGFPPSFVNIIKLLYSNPRASVIINGHRASAFVIGRGVRQGDPLSPLLFAIVIEPLLDAIRTHPNFKGIKVPFCPLALKLSAFADDTTPFISDPADFEILYQILDTFGLASGLRLNKSKVMGLWLSRSATPPLALRDKCEWLKRGVVERVLGYRLGINVSIADQHQHVIDKIRTRLHLFSARAFSLSARVTCLKMCIHSILWYFAFVLPTSTDMIKTLNRWCFNFLWRKPFTPLIYDKTVSGKISRATLALPRHSGGLNFQGIEVQLTALRSKWLRLFLDHRHSAAWKDVVLHSRIHAAASPWLPRSPSIIFAPFSNFSRLPHYIIPVLQHLSTLSITRTTPPSPPEIVDAPLFFNADLPSLLGDSTSPIGRFRQWADAGFITVGALFDSYGDPLSLNQCIEQIDANLSPTNPQHNRRLRALTVQYDTLHAAIPTRWRSIIPLAKSEFEFLRHEPNLAKIYSVSFPNGSHPIPISALTSAVIRENLVISLTRHHIPRYVTYWNQHFPSSYSLPWRLIWSSCQARILSFRHQEFLWTLAHAALYVGDNPKVLAIARHSNTSPANCPHCAAPESILHALYDCPFLSIYWNWIYSFSHHFLRLQPSVPDFRRHIILGDFMLHNVPEGIHYDTWLILRASSLYAAWKIRCSAAYDQDFVPPVTPQMLFAIFKQQLALYANCHFTALNYSLASTAEVFHHRWLPGFLTIYRKHVLKIVANPPTFDYTPQAVCLCSHHNTFTPPLSTDTDDFLPLPPPPSPCSHCGAPPPFYPYSYS